MSNQDFDSQFLGNEGDSQNNFTGSGDGTFNSNDFDYEYSDNYSYNIPDYNYDNYSNGYDYEAKIERCMNLWNARKEASAPVQAQITDTQNKIYNLMSDLRRRTSGRLVNESQLQRMYDAEKAVLDGQLNSLNNELNRIKEQYPVC